MLLGPLATGSLSSGLRGPLGGLKKCSNPDSERCVGKIVCFHSHSAVHRFSGSVDTYPLIYVSDDGSENTPQYDWETGGIGCPVSCRGRSSPTASRNRAFGDARDRPCAAAPGPSVQSSVGGSGRLPEVRDGPGCPRRSARSRLADFENFRNFRPRRHLPPYICFRRWL
jgi:hypothetical protein